MPWVKRTAVAAYPPHATRTDVKCNPDNASVFFPERHSAATDAAAKAVCGTCPARTDCLIWALRHDRTTGVLGGMSPAERRAMWEEIRQRRRRVRWDRIRAEVDEIRSAA